MEDNNLKTLYNSLKRDNYDVPDNYDSFERTLTNDKHARRTLYNSLKRDNYDVPDSYDSFDRTLFPVTEQAVSTTETQGTGSTTAPNALKQQDAATGGSNSTLGKLGTNPNSSILGKGLGALQGGALGGAIGALQAGGQQNGGGTNDYQWSYNPPQPEPEKEQPVVQQNNGVPQQPAPTTTPTTDATQKAEDDDAKTLEYMAAANKGLNGRDISRGVDQNGNRYSKEIRGNNIIYSYDDKSVAQYVVDEDGNTKLKRYQYSNGDVDVHNDDGSVTKIETPHYIVFNPSGEVRMKSDDPISLNPNLSKYWSRNRSSLPSYVNEYAGKSEAELHDVINKLGEQSYMYDSNSAEYADLAARQNSAALQLVAKQCGFANLAEAEKNPGKFDYERFKYFVATNYPCELTDKLLDGSIQYEPMPNVWYGALIASELMSDDILNNKLQGGDYYINSAMLSNKEELGKFYSLCLGEALRTGQRVDSIIKREWDKISMKINENAELAADDYLQRWIDNTPKWLLYTGYALGNSITGGIGVNIATNPTERHQVDLLFNKYQSTLSGGAKLGADVIGLVADLPLYMLASEGAGALIGPEALAASAGARVFQPSLTMLGVGLVGQGVQDWHAGEFSGVGQWLSTGVSSAATGATLGVFGEAARGVALRPTSKAAVLFNKGVEYIFETAGFTLPEWVSTVYNGVTPEGDPITGDYFWHSAVHNLGVVVAMKGRRNFKNWKPVVNKGDLAQLQTAYPELYDNLTHNLDMATRGKPVDELSDAARKQLAQLQDDMNTPGKGVSWTTYKKTMNLFGFEVVPPRPSSVRVEGNVVQVLDSGGNVITEKKCANNKAATQERDKLHSQIEHDTERVNAQRYDAARREKLYYDTCSDIADRMSDNKEWRKRGEDGNFLVDENGNYIPDENYRCVTPEDVDAALKEAYQTPEGERTADQVQLITTFEAAAKQMSNSVPTVRDLAQMVCDIYGISVDQLERASNLEPSSRRKGDKTTQAMALFNDLLNRGVTTSGKPVGRVKLKTTDAVNGDTYIDVYNEANPANKDGYYFYKDANGTTRWLAANEVESYEPIMNESEQRYKVSNNNAKATLDRVIGTYTKEASLYNDELLDMRINNLLDKYNLKLDEEGNILRKEGAKRGEADIDENGMRTDDADLLKLQTFLKVRQDRAAAKQGEDNMRNLRSERERAEAVAAWGQENGVTYDVDYLVEHPLELDELVKKMDGGETAELSAASFVDEGTGTGTTDESVGGTGTITDITDDTLNAADAAQYETAPTTKTTPTSIEAGGRYQVADGEGTHDVEVLRDNGNGTLEVRVDGEQHTIPLDILQQMLGIDVALTTPQTEQPATTTKLEQPAPVATNEMKEADVDAGETGLSLREKAGAYVDAYFPDVKGDEREGFIEQLVAQNDFENTIRFDKEDGVNLDRVAKYEEALRKLEEAKAAENVDKEPEELSTAVDKYRIADDADEKAIGMAGFTRDNIQATADYLNGKLGKREYLERLGFDKDVLAGIDDDKVNTWVEGVANRASEFLTDKPVESGEVRVESDEASADTGATLTPTPQPEAADATKEVEATPEPMPMREVKSGKTTETEPDWLAVTPERGHDWLFDESGLDNADANEIVNNNLEAAQKGVEKASKQKPKKTTNPFALQAERERIANEQAAAQSALDYWKQVKAIEQDRQAQAAAERKAKDAAAIEQAKAEEEQRRAEELAKQQEQAERGAGEQGEQGNADAGQSDLAQTENITYQLSDEVDENGRQFVLTSDGNLEFGEIGSETGLTPAPILLSEGMITNRKTNDGYGLVHIEARHGKEIRNKGYKSVVDFIEEVAKNYEVIREGKSRDGIQTYMLQLTDKHNNTLMVELSNDGTYWNINTAGIFKTSYGAKRTVVYNRHTTANQPAETDGASLSGEQGGTTPSTSMNAPAQTDVVSGVKDRKKKSPVQENSEKNGENQGEGKLATTPQTEPSKDAAIVEASKATNTEPTDAQKEAGNYKKGHVKIDGFDISIEQPKGSVRSGVDATGKAWSQKMNNTYGYIRGTEGVDGDHIDVFLSDNLDGWNGTVYVVDQVNKDGSFDEHKVMYGFNSEEDARKAYLSNYEEGWQGLGAITPVSKEEFKKWVDSSHRKTKPFAEYKNVKVEDLNTTSVAQHKRMQMEIINQTNPMTDDVHTGIRSESDILTLEEAVEESLKEGERGGWDTLSSYPDVPNEVLEEALRTGKIRVYSSDPIEDGVFVTPSRMQAEDYAGGDGSKVYEKEVPIEDVAWINTDEGQLARVSNAGDTGVVKEDAVKYETASRNTGRDIALDDRVSQREYLLSDNYVANLTGKEFAKSETPLTEKVARFYAENYGGKVERDGVGTVLLDERSVKDSIAHGIGRNKAVAFAAVPDIIKNGAIIDRQENWKGRGYGSVTFAAPLEIGGKGYVGVVVAKELLDPRDGSHRFYLHEVALQKNLLSEEFKTGMVTGSKQGDVAKVLKEIVTAKENSGNVANEDAVPYGDISERGTSLNQVPSVYDVIKVAREAASGEPYANGYGASSYHHGTTEDGDKYTIRVADHPLKWENLEFHGDLDGRVLSIVITDDPDNVNDWKERGFEEVTDRDGYDVEQYILNADDIDIDMLTDAIENYKKNGRSYGRNEDGELVGIQESGNGIAFERGSSYRNGNGDVIKFESHAEQLSLFNGGDVAMTSQRTERATERAKRVKEMSDAELLKEMQRDIAEFEKLGRGDWGIQTACTDEYDRRHIKEYNAECERVRTMLDENNVSIEKAEDMLCNAIYSWRDGYATADRSKLLAQFDTLNDYYAEKTDERDNADLYQEVESKQAISEADARNTETPTQQEVAPTTEQTEPAKPKKAAFDPSAIKLRKLKSGETCYVERRYQESGGFDFTGSEVVKSDEDLAYIFRNLENSAIENTFLVLIKNGKATILHTGMGSYSGSVGHTGAGMLAASQFKPQNVIMVHNHPSGNLVPSMQDVELQKRVKRMFGEDVVREAIIIDITSGQYSVFDTDNTSGTIKQRPTSAENEIPYKTYSFSKYVFNKDYKPGSTMQITDANKAAAFVSSHRLGERDKLSLLVMNRAKYITGNVFLPWTNLDDVDIKKAANKIATYIHQMGGESGIIYGSGTIDRSMLGALSREIENHEVRLDDFINVEGVSAQVQGVLEPEVNYGDTFRNVEEANKYVENLPRQWNIPKDFATYHALGSKTALEDFISRASLSKEDADVLRENYYDDDVLGCGSPDKDMVILFTEKFKSKKVLANIAAHETFHVAYKYLGRDEHNRFNNAILNWFRSQSWGDKFVEALHQSYDTSKWATETMAYFVGHEVGKYGWDKFLSGEIDYGNEEIHNFVSRFKNIITNGNISQISGEPRGEALSDVERAGQRGRQPGERGSNEQSDDRGWQRASSSLVNEEGVGYGDADDSGISDEDLAGYDAGRYSVAENLTIAKMRLAEQNRNDNLLRLQAMRYFSQNLRGVHKAMAAQKKYDKNTVENIVRLTRAVMGNGFFKDMSAYEVKRLLAAIKKGEGAEDLTPIANNVVDMLVQHQLRESKNMLHKLMQVRGRKVDARGVEVQAGLDIDGQRMMSALKDGMSLGENGLLTRINDCENRLGSEDEVIRKNAMSEYQGLMLAKEYHDNILSGEEEEIVLRNEKRQEQEKICDFRREPVLDDDGNAIINQDGSVRTVERKTLKPQFKNNVTDENKQLRRNTEAAIERIEQSIRESRMERVTSYIDFMSDVAGDVRASRERARAWREAQIERVNRIHHFVNSDLEGVDISTQNREKKHVPLFNPNNAIVRTLFMPLATFEKFMRYFGHRKFTNGEGYMFNHFVRGMIDCEDKEWRIKRGALDELSEKITELFGKNKLNRNRRAGDLKLLVRGNEYKTIPVEYWDNGKLKEDELYQSEAIKFYLWSKQKDTEAGLRRMGITEEDIEAIKKLIDPKLIKFFDWVIEDFIPKFSIPVNEVYERMFGAPMPAVENYFPIVRNEADVDNKEKDVTERLVTDRLASTIAKSWIKRTRNSAPLDVHADAIDILLDYIEENAQKVAWTEYYRDLNTLLNYKRFEHKVKNMSSMEFGEGKYLWKSFENCVAILTGVYEHSGGKSDEFMVNISKGFTAGAIAFRVNTALKQFASATAFWGDARIDKLLEYQTPFGWYQSWVWAMENLPGYSKRWQSKQVGDTRLMDTDVDWKVWRNKYMDILSKSGLATNAFVDALTVATGSRAVYETKKPRYLRIGYSEENAEKRALQDAAMSYKSAQQESMGGYVSEVQVKRTFWNVLRSMFRNASMSYSRRFTTAVRELKDRAQKGYKERNIEAETKRLMRDGISADKARKEAHRLYRFGGLHALFNLMNFGYLTPFVWSPVFGSIWYLLFGDDDEKKKEIIEEGKYRAPFYPLEGLLYGNNISDIGSNVMRYWWSEDKEEAMEYLKNHDFFSTPVESETERFIRHLSNDSMAAWWDVFSLAIQTNLGVKPEVLTDAIAAIADCCEDPMTTKEALLVIARVLQVPQSQTDDIFIDELGLTAKDAQKLNAMEMADRYAKYKRFKTSPLSYIIESEEDKKIHEKYRNRFLDNMQERMEKMDDEQLEWNFVEGDTARKKAVTKTYFKARGIKDGYSSGSSGEYAHIYSDSRLYSDMAEDALLQLAKTQAENRGDKEQLKAIDYIKSEILTPVLSGEKTGVGQMKAETLEKLGRYAVLTEMLRNEKRRRENAEGLKGMTGDKDSDEKVLRLYRELRKELLRELGVIQ